MGHGILLEGMAYKKLPQIIIQWWGQKYNTTTYTNMYEMAVNFLKNWVVLKWTSPLNILI